MNKKNLKYTFAVLFAASSFALADDAKIQYFDCWMENIDKIDSSELKRLNIQPKQFSNSTWLCGCYSVEERGGYGWRYGDGSPKITKIWDLPKFDLYSCRTRSCTEGNGEFNDNLDQCVSYLNSTGFNLSNFDEGKSLNKAIAQKFADDGSLTDFGHYFKNRMDRLDKIPCFFQYHGRPDAAKFADWDRKGVFSISGLPPKFLPAAIGRFTDYSDVRCKDGLEWTGFASNGYIENIMHVDSTGKFHGTETGFGNDPRFPVRQSSEFGRVLWTAEYRHGKKNGSAKFFRYSAVENVECADSNSANSKNSYYFMHLDVPYRNGVIYGTVNMFSNKGALLAEIPYKNNVLEGRVTVHNPFDKKVATAVFRNGQLYGPNDFGYFFANYKDGLLNGKKIEFNYKEKCYEWIPANCLDADSTRSNIMCRIEKAGKKKWGTYKDGELQGMIECANGIKGTGNIDCENAF